jgi:tetratricopeptide (TPR) repeat protein
MAGLLVYFMLDQTGRLTAVKTALRQELSTEIQKAQAVAVPSEVAQRLMEKLSYLELRQTAVIDESRNSMQRQYYIFTTVAAFFGLFTVFFGYRQLLVESRGSDAREKHDQEMRNLVRSFQNNITTISSLITTLEKSFDYRKTIADELEKFQKRTQVLEHHQEEGDMAFTGLVSSLNSDALTVIPLGVDRAALSFDENTRRMENFVGRLTVAEQRTRNVEAKLNPFCYYVRGLRNVTTYQYELAIADLDIVARKARQDVTAPNLETYPADRRENLKGLLEHLLTSCSYFQGICHKNLGQYPASLARFKEALDRNPNHWESRNYLLQVMFFDKDTPFPAVETEFANACQRLEGALKEASQDEREKLKRAGNILKINQGDIYFRAPLLQEFRTGYRRYESPEKAAQAYWEAVDYLPNDLAHFCLAQALEQVGSSLWRGTTYQKEYEAAFKGLKRRVAGDFDKLYSVTLYYMLGICASKLPEHKATSEVFLSQARHGLKEIPTQVTCFSPVSRIRLSRSQILEELEAFERIKL